jgi:GntR family transcriptional repressor for pyruvate dehydrogenase complex
VTDPSLQPIARTPLYEQVVDRLRAFIELHELKPGDRLMSERDLAVRLGVSRASVRQALTALKVLGLVEIKHGDGVYLLRSSQEIIPSLASEIVGSEFDHAVIWEVREAIEVQAARLAARRRTDDDLIVMRNALEEMEGSISGGGDGVEGDANFHRAVVAAAHNALLQQLVVQLADAIDRTSEASLTYPGRPSISLERHRTILEAIAGGDEEAASAQMREHVLVSRRGIAAGDA